MLHLLMTHEQSDFDALAALVAARSLESDSIALMPRRVNRNVRAFLTLYREELPLDDPEDLPRGHVDRVTLLDTQTMPALRGVDASTQVHIVDHHPVHRGLPEGWSASVDPVGATTTLLVESLQALAHPPTVPEATLYLLGIYEDTGSLSYAGTTPRDIRAAAWLLEQGASLRLAADFLNHPLSDGQRALYDRLLESAEMREINGQRIVLAQADAPGEVEEISTLAHKLRDVFDPDALFVLVNLGSHIQLVARSTTDLIDVAEVALRLGGGGHSRAAAALIRGKTLVEARQALLAELPGAVTAPIPVSQIYSPRPQIMEAGGKISEAAERMARYGYEGFPVVREGKVAGLVTRRAVDRAMAHGMQGAAVDSIMEAGSVSVTPADSISHLQRLMVDRGWGQIPVVAPEDGRVIGIVTRTDLLTALTTGPAAGRLNLADRMTVAFPPARLALLRAVASAADSRRMPLYLVGGVVRDLLLDIPAFDLDLVVEGDAIALARELARRFGGRVRGHERFGTAKWLLEKIDRAALGLPTGGGDLPPTLDLVSARAEFYAHPSALPEVERGNLKLDLHRRDFTINTLALSLNAAQFGAVHDYWGGLRDLEERRIRVLHSISFVDDPTRILRAVRLEQRLGFRIDPRTSDLIGHALPLLHRVSGDRIRHELEAIFGEPDPGKALARLQELDVLRHIAAPLGWSAEAGRRVHAAREFRPLEAWKLRTVWTPTFPPFAAWLLEYAPETLGTILARLNTPKHEAEMVLDARRTLDALAALPPDSKPSSVADVLDEVTEGALAAAWPAADSGKRAWLAAYLSEWRAVHPHTGGDALRVRGLRPGPAFRRILHALRSARLDGEIRTLEEERRMLDDLLEKEAAASAPVTLP